METKTRSKQPFCLSEGSVGDPVLQTMMHFPIPLLARLPMIAREHETKRIAGVSLKNVRPLNVTLESTHHKPVIKLPS